MYQQIYEYWWVLPLLLIVKAYFVLESSGSTALWSLAIGIIIGHYIFFDTGFEIFAIIVLFVCLWGLLKDEEKGIFISIFLGFGIVLGYYMK